MTAAENSLPPYAAINSRSNMSCVAIPRQPMAMRRNRGLGARDEGRGTRGERLPSMAGYRKAGKRRVNDRKDEGGRMRDERPRSDYQLVLSGFIPFCFIPSSL